MRVGDAVSLRIRTPAGPTEVVGTLVAATDRQLTVRRRDGSVIDVTIDSVAAGRVVPPAPAQRVSATDLQVVAARGWRALEQQRLGDWLLRASGGFTGRGNSALAVGDPGVDRSAAIDLVEGWYADRGLPPRLQLPDPAGSADLDRELADRGWSASPRVHVMTAELGPVLRGLPPTGVDVLLADRPDDAWLSVYRQDAAERSEVGASAPAAVALLVNHDNVVFVSVRDGDRCVAVARASVDERWTGLFCVEVVPDRRREGLARAVSIAALQWSGRHGARRCYLQVSSDNDGGTGLYSGLGFTVHHDYIYRAAPPPP